jgi:DNA polymerase
MIVTFDIETHYSQEYSLRRMSTAAYVLDYRYQTILAAIQVGDGPCDTFIGHDAVAAKLATFDWSTVALLSHNTSFDGSVLAWRFGHVPAMYLDSLGMARATVHPVTGRSSLEKVSEYLDLPPKGNEVTRAIGKRLEDFAPDEIRSYADYCVRDALNCRAIFDRLRPFFNNSELRLIDILCRMFILPQIKLDPHVLAEHLHQVRADKAAIMARVAHLDPSVFSSNQKFAALLESYGVEVPRKISPTTGEETWALAKNDRAFKELTMDESQPLEVQALLAARINSKSTLEETRTDRLLQHSLRSWCHGDVDRRLPDRTSGGVSDRAHSGWGAVPLKYYGARTGRPSGDGGENWLNFKRGSRIREAIRAPDGYRCIHRDASQIEARMVAWLAKCEKLLEAFRQKRDVYSDFSSGVYGRQITKADTLERFVGKTCILGLGYGTGWEKLRHTLFIGNGGISVNVDEAEAKRLVYHYRNTYLEIPSLWTLCEHVLEHMIGRSGRRRHPVAKCPDELPVEIGFDALWLPNQMCIAYPNIRRDRGTGECCYDDPYGGARKIYGAKVTENISQALARIIVTDIICRVYDLTGRHPFLTTYDSVDYCVPEDEAQWWDQELERQFAVVPEWAPGLPLASDGGWGVNLLAAEKMENN